MAESQEPAGNASDAPERSTAITSSSTPLGDRQFFAPQDLTAPAEASYQTLSLLALVGFIIGAAFAAIVGLMAVIAFFSGKPLLIAGWTFVCPIAAVLLCVIARFRIAQSEGTLAGGTLANWGLMAALIVGLCAGAYQAAVYFALKQQSEAAITEWFDLIREGELEKALLRTLSREVRSEMREEDPNLGQAISRAVSREQNGGYYNEVAKFSQKPEVRAVLQAGADARIELLGIRDWEYSNGGFYVAWNATLATRELEAELEIVVHGVDSPNPDEGRIWTITAATVTDQGRALKMTAFGQRFGKRFREGSTFWKEWAQKILRGEKLEAFLDTLPEGRRAQARAELGRAAALGLASGAAAMARTSTAESPAFTEYRRFLAAGFLTLDEKRFVATKTVRDVLLPVLREQLAKLPPFFNLGEIHTPPLRMDDANGRFQMEFTTAIQIPPEITAIPTAERPIAEYHAEFLVVVEGDAKALESEIVSAGWRLAGIRLVGGRQVTGPAKPPGPRSR